MKRYSCLEKRTSLDLGLLHILPRHWIAPNDFFQRGSLEILFARLFFRVMFAGVLFQAFQPVCLATELVLGLLKEFT